MNVTTISFKKVLESTPMNEMMYTQAAIKSANTTRPIPKHTKDVSKSARILQSYHKNPAATMAHYSENGSANQIIQNQI